MKKNLNSGQKSDRHHSGNIPALQIIDLDAEENDGQDIDSLTETGTADDFTEWETEDFGNSSAEWETEDPETEPAEDESTEQEAERKGFHLNMHTTMHIALLAVAVIVFIVIGYRITHWGQFISQGEIFSDGEGTYDNSFDLILPALDAEGNLITTSGKDTTILLLGNSPFSDWTDPEDSVANIIAGRTGANVINCSVSGSYMASEQSYLNTAVCPMDAFIPYWLCVLTCTDAIDYSFHDALEYMGEEAPPEAARVAETMFDLDMNTVDFVVFMYDGTDYLLGHEMYNDDNATDIQTFTGNLEASIELLQHYYPHVRIIVMSPTYAFGIDDNGEYISSDIQTYGQHFLSTYSTMEYASCVTRGVTFVDNLYGTINEDNASEYLSDNIHLNAEGRKLVADRLLYALTYYDQQ